MASNESISQEDVVLLRPELEREIAEIAALEFMSQYKTYNKGLTRKVLFDGFSDQEVDILIRAANGKRDAILGKVSVATTAKPSKPWSPSGVLGKMDINRARDVKEIAANDDTLTSE
jgi:hypothetical protein